MTSDKNVSKNENKGKLVFKVLEIKQMRRGTVLDNQERGIEEVHRCREGQHEGG